MMLPLSRIMLAMILAGVVQFVDGNQKIIHVSELISDYEDFFTSGEGDSNDVCCEYGNCSCNSLDHALANLGSNILINVTTDVMLSLLITASNLQNVSIIGHNNPTVKCKTGGIYFIFCHNCIIQGITWNGCGTNKSIGNHTVPGLKLSNSSNVTIQNCCFQHSVGQAVVLSEASGDVNITNCKFANNVDYGGHGAAIHYSSDNARKSQFVFIINNCNFTSNGYTKSVVYIENKLFESHKIMFNYSIFWNNQGTYICLHNKSQNLFEWKSFVSE